MYIFAKYIELEEKLQIKEKKKNQRGKWAKDTSRLFTEEIQINMKMCLTLFVLKKTKIETIVKSYFIAVKLAKLQSLRPRIVKTDILMTGKRVIGITLCKAIVCI